MTDGILRSWLARRAVGIVFGAHGAAKSFKNKTVESVHIAYDDFTAVVEYLREMDFDFLSTDQVIALSRSGFKHHKHWTHLSFDDGYQNNFDAVYPYLKERGIPFSVYVSTYYIENQDYMPTFYLRYAESLDKDLAPVLPEPTTLTGDLLTQAVYRHVMYAPIEKYDEGVARVKALFTTEELGRMRREFYNDKPMSLECLKEMARDPLVHIGSHSHRHVILHPEQNPTPIRDELLTSIRRLREDWKVSREPTFCYPNGDYNAQSTTICRDLGFPLVHLTESGFVSPNTYPLRIPRFWIATARRARLVCRLAALGNAGIYLFGRKPPAGVGAA